MEVRAGQGEDGGPSDRPSPRRAAGLRRLLVRWEVAFLLIGSLAGGALVVAIPPMAGIDEPAHLYRLTLIDAGFAIPPHQGDARPDYAIDGCVDTYFYWLVLSPGLTRTEQLAEQSCGEDAPVRERPIVIAAEGYPPLPYAPAWVGYRVGRAAFGVPIGLLVARAAQLVAYLLLAAAAIRVAPWGKPFLFAVALLPVALHTGSGVSADPVTLGLALLALAAALDLVARSRAATPASARRLVAVGAAFVLLGMAKPGYAPLALVLVAVPTGAFGSWRRRVAAVAATLGLVAVTNLAWIVGVTAHQTAPPRPWTDPVAQATWARSSPIDFVRTVGRTWTDAEELDLILPGAVGPVSRVEGSHRAPVWVAVGAAATVATTLALSARRAPRPPAPHAEGGPGPTGAHAATTEAARPDDALRRAAGLALRRIDPLMATTVLGITAAMVLLVSYAMAIATNPVDPDVIIGIQGRYFLPLAPLCLFVLRPPEPARSSVRSLPWLPVVQAVVLVGYVVAYNGAVA